MKRKRKRSIRLRLSEDWFKFYGTNFKSVGSQRNFQIGDILKKQDQYFGVTRKGLKLIKEKFAFKKIIKATKKINPNYLSEARILLGYRGVRIRDKIKVQHDKIYKKAPCPWNKCVLFNTNISVTLKLNDKDARELETIFFNRTNNIQYSPEAVEKANEILMRIVIMDQRLTIKIGKLEVKSLNKKTYRIDLTNGKVYSRKNEICVQVPNNIMPLLDKILAKALMIAYMPEEISTL